MKIQMSLVYSVSLIDPFNWKRSSLPFPVPPGEVEFKKPLASTS